MTEARLPAGYRPMPSGSRPTGWTSRGVHAGRRRGAGGEGDERLSGHDFRIVREIAPVNAPGSGCGGVIRALESLGKEGPTEAFIAKLKAPLFRSAKGKTRTLTEKPLRRNNAPGMVKRRTLAAGLPPRVCNHIFRATGITSYLENGGTIEKAQQIAAHESPKTTKLYDRSNDQITLDEIERIAI